MEYNIFETGQLPDDKPAIQVLHACSNSKITFFVLKKDVILKKHKSPVPAQIWVIKGSVKYLQNGEEYVLNELTKKNIPDNVFHELRALEDCHCILIQNSIMPI